MEEQSSLLNMNTIKDNHHIKVSSYKDDYDEVYTLKQLTALAAQGVNIIKNQIRVNALF